jgi:alpha-tubulin suppressor-like RCC1 family protein
MNTIGDYSPYSNEASITISPPVWSALAAGESHSLALTTNGTLWGWGDNQYAQLDPTNYASSFTRPTLLNPDTDWITIASGYYHTLAIKTNLTLWSWGDNSSGQLGLGNTELYSVPSPVGMDSDWSMVRGGANHTLATKTNLTIWSCGANSIWDGGQFLPGGQLGLGDSVDRNALTQIGTDSDWFTVAAGAAHTIAIKTNRTLWAWGWNNYDQLGDGTQEERTSPMQIGTDSDWQSIAGGSVHSIALKTIGTLWEWGKGSLFSPQQVGSGTDWAMISAGGSNQGGTVEAFSLALKTNQSLWSWGENNFGQLGLGDTNDRTAPAQNAEPPNWNLVAAGGWNTIACDAAGDLWAWGRNERYQLGLGNTVNYNITINLNLPQPTNLVAVVITYTTIALFWTDNSDRETGFAIERSISPTTNYSLIATVGADTTSYSDATVTRSNTYYYRVKAYLGGIDSLYSNVAFGTTILWLMQIDQGAVGSPSVRYRHSMVWDGQKVIMFGGWADGGEKKNDLWWYVPTSGTNGTWIDKTTTDISPTARYNHSMVWDGQRVIMFGGYDGSFKNDLWWYEPGTNTWTEKIVNEAVGSPSARYRQAMVWDTVRQGVIMFGGSGTSPIYKNDLWWYDPNFGTTGVWFKQIDQDADGSPSARQNHSMVWDGQKVIMFGGNDGVSKNDLWWYDPASGTNGTWIQQFTSIMPSGRMRHSTVWDSIGQRVIMFGGFGTSPTYKNDLWWYDPVTNTWTEKITNGAAGSPSARNEHSMIWDGTRLIMFGGNDGANKNDLWWW